VCVCVCMCVCVCVCRWLLCDTGGYFDNGSVSKFVRVATALINARRNDVCTNRRFCDIHVYDVHHKHRERVCVGVCARVCRGIMHLGHFYNISQYTCMGWLRLVGSIRF